jgi:exosome complex component RRP42
MLDKAVIRDIITKGSRIDGRKFDEYRKITIQTNVIKNAEGSARCEIGDTKVIAGVKLEPGEPFPDTPNEGVLVVNAEFLPIASPEFEPGPPGEEAIELARVVDRIIRESNSIALDKLSIDENKVWKVMIDIVVLDHYGNLIDASALASMVALMNTKIPCIEKEDDRIIVNRDIRETQLPLNRTPITVTVCKIVDKLIVDPNLKEEQALDARLTIGLFYENEQTFLCALQKGGSDGFTKDEVKQAIEIAKIKSRELLEILKDCK